MSFSGFGGEIRCDFKVQVRSGGCRLCGFSPSERSGSDHDSSLL